MPFGLLGCAGQDGFCAGFFLLELIRVDYGNLELQLLGFALTAGIPQLYSLLRVTDVHMSLSRRLCLADVIFQRQLPLPALAGGPQCRRECLGQLSLRLGLLAYGGVAGESCQACYSEIMRRPKAVRYA